LLAVNRIECAFILGRVVAAKRRGIDGHALDIHRDVEPARTGASTLREVPGALEVVADGKWIVDQYCIFGNVRDHGDDVGFLVSELAQARDPSARMQVSRLTWPETTSIGMESVHARRPR